MRRAVVCILVLMGLCGCSKEAKRPETSPLEAAQRQKTKHTKDPGWLKGQLHLHSARSGDSATPPEEVVRWYADHGYHFIVFTDHNAPHHPPPHPTMLTFTGVEWTFNLNTCDPLPEPGMGCLLHMNGLFLESLDRRVSLSRHGDGARRFDVYKDTLKATKALGGIAMLNHPNFHYSADSALVTALAKSGLVLMEVANEAIDSNNEGDATHPSTEALWDEVLSAGGRIYGTATDDAHHYNDAKAVIAAGKIAHTGDRGFVMVQAHKTRASIMEALRRGTFYSSSGLVLGDVRVEGKTLVIEAQPGGAPLVGEFIGPHGKILKKLEGERLTFKLDGLAGYVRARVSNKTGKAWTQPIFLDP